MKNRRNLIAAAVGNTLETYDFTLYGTLTPILAENFFPSADKNASILSAFSVFAVGFLGRPVGAALFGHIGDRVGRKKALIISILLIALPTALIGLLPTYAQIGIIAPLLLIIMRLLQGISYGGESAGAIIFMVEHAPASKRGLTGSLSLGSNALGVLLGVAIAGVLSTTMDRESLYTWGWRIPFLLGIVVAAIALYMRLGIDETPSFARLEQGGNIPRAPLKEVVSSAKKELFTIIGLTWLAAVLTFMIFVYMITYLSVVIGMPLSQVFGVITIGLILVVVLQPVMGFLSDRVGRKPLLITGSAGALLLAYPLFTLLSHGDLGTSILAIAVFSVLLTCIGGPLPATVVEITSERTRFSLISIGFGLSQAFFAGITPIVATLLIETTRNNSVPAIYVMISALSTLIISIMMRDRYRDTIS